jgi:hypothetical protein
MYVEYTAVPAIHTDHWQILMPQTTALRHNVEHQLMFYGAIARNTCSISDCDTLWEVMGAEVICKCRFNVVQKY